MLNFKVYRATRWVCLLSLLTVAARAEVFTVTLTAPSPVITQTPAGCRVKVAGFASATSPGQPQLPSQIFRIAVPPDIDWATLKVKTLKGQSQPLELSMPVAPTAPNQANAAGALPHYPAGAHIVDGRDMNIYSLVTSYPESPIRLVPHGQMRKWRIAQVCYNPVQWNPITGETQYWPEMQVELEYDRIPAAAGAPSIADDPLMADCAMDELAATTVVNFQQAAPWYTPSESAKADHKKSFVGDYLIVTANTIVSHTPKLQDFIKHKTALGHAVSVITETDYNSVTAPYPNYREDKIRQWLKTHYASWGFSYVLLIGNPTPDMAYPESIPMKMTWPRLNEDDNRESPTDMFFSDLTGNWNISGDGLFGNPDDCSTDGGVDLFPEVYVGRIPFYGSYPDLSSILQKIMDYDNQANVAWRKSILLPMSFSADGYDGAPLAEQMWDDYLKLYGFSRWRQYQQGHGACSLNSDYPSDQELRGGSVVSNRWAANPYGIVCWWGHGNVDIAVVGYGDYCWDGDLFKSSMTSVLNDEFPAFTFQCSCLNGYPENYHNLQYQLLLRGGIGTVGATRDSWFNTGYGYGDFNGAAPNAGIGYEYVKRLAAGNKAGPSLAWAKAAVIGDIGSDCDWWMNQFDFNLYGDPSSQINLAKEYFPLADNTPWHMTAVPRRYSFPVNSYSWAAVGMRPGSEDHDLRADTHVGLPSPYAVSDLPGITPEIVVANGHNLGSATHYAEVYFGDETPYTIEAENNADGLNLETWHSRSLRTNDVIDLTQATVTSGHIYEVTADVTSGSPDLMLFVFGPGRNVGSRSSYDRFSNTAGAGGTEALTYTTTASGSLGILVVNRTSVAGVYNLRVRDISPIASPTSVSATDGTASDRVTVTWSTVSGASYYRVYRNTANDTVGAVAVSGWITANSYADLTAEVGTRYYYWVSAALDNAGFRASLLDTLDTGYVQPATLVHDVKVTVTNDPSYYQFSETANYWVAVGVRQDNPADNWSLRLYTAPDFVTQQAASYYVVPVDFVAVDRNRAPNVLRGVQPYRVTGSNSATLEFDGAAEQLSLGITTNLNWLAGEVVKMRDISLTSATYRVTLTVTAGTADLDVALFSSSDGNYYRSREQYVARSTRPAGVPDTFYVTVTNTDWYGLCVWANDTNSATYRLEVVPVFAGLWEGDISDDWHTPGNWNNNAVPVAANDVTIPPRTPYSPRIYRGLAYCSNLTVQTSAKLTINTNELYMSGDAHIHGYLNMDSTLARFHLGGDMVWEPGSTATMLASARILITGDWYFEDGANVQLTSGYVEFEGARTSSIRCYDANCNLYNLNCSKYAPYYLGVSGLSTADLPINNLYIYNGTAFRSYSTHNVIIRGFMNNMGGAFQWANGGAVFTGNPGVVTLHPTPTSYFNDLVQNGTGPLVLGNAYTNYLRIAGDVTIASSAIDSASFQIAVGGNWTNGVGRPGFLCRTGAVTFNGVSSQYVYGSNVFYTVNDSRSGRGTLWLNDDLVVSNIHHVASIHGVKGRMNVIGSLDLNSTTAQFAVYTGGNVTTARLDQGGHLSLLGGQFFASDLFDNGLFGRYTINEGSATLQQNAAQYIDLNAIVDIANGTLRVVGGLGYSDWPYSLNGSLTMSGGVLDFDAAGIRINNGAYKLTNNITGGRIRTSGDLVVTNPTFNPPGGEVEFYGSTSRTLNLVTGSGLHSSIINKTAATVTASTNVVLSGDFTLQSGVFAAPTLMTVAGSWANSVGPAGFVEGVGTVAFNGAAAASILTDETFYNLTLSKTYTDFDALQLADGIHVTAGNNFTCTDGALEMSAASVLNVRGDVTLARGAGLNASAPNTAVYVGGYWVNQNTNHTIYNGFEPGVSSRVTFDGVRTTTLTTDCPAEEFQDLVIDRPSGALRPNDSVYVNGQLKINNGYWSSFVGGLQHHLRGDVYVGPGGSWGDSAPANTVWFTGANDATINYAGTNGYFPNITIDKSGGAGVRLLSDLLQLGGVGLTVAQGTYNLNGHLDRLTAGAIVTSNAVLTVGAGGRLDLASGKTLAVQPGGRLEVIGAAGNPATISRQSGNYTVLIQSNATIAASQAVFEYLDTDGVYVMDGGIVDLGASFNDCTFRNGVAGGSLLRVENNQTFIAMRTAFPINAGGGAANVRKSSDQGRITFRDATGIFAGENFDNDPYNRLDWDFGLLSTATLDIPSYVTLGGRYEAKASVGPTNASEPIYYVWTATDGSPTQHVGGITGDRLKFSWKTPGIKTVQLVASNQWGLVTATQSVIVQALRIADIQPQPGTNTIRLVIEGTTPASHYEIECTPDMDNVPWTRVMPHGSGWTGSMSNTVWMDYSTSQRPLESFTNLFYRARVLLPAEPLPSTSATK